MKNKGFTLVELLAVIAILAIIVIIAYPIINNVIDNAKENAYQDQLSFIEHAADLYVVENTNGEVITINDLVGQGFLKEIPTDPRTNTPMDGNTEIKLLNGDYCVSVADNNKQCVDIPNLAMGPYNTSVVNDGKLYVAGYNVYGQLGVGDKINRTSLVEITISGETVSKVYTGSSNTAIITASGKLYMTGYNYYGQLGVGDTTDRTVPTEITISGERISKVESSSNSLAILTESGKLYTTGMNNFGQLGVGDTTDRDIPTQLIISGETISDVSVGNYHMAILTESGKLYMAGNNSSGQLGVGDTTSRSTPTQVTISGETISDVLADEDHTLIITASGKLYGTGYNYYGQLGLGDTTDRTSPTQVTISGETISKVTSAGNNTAIITNSGKLYTTGRNNNGQLGLGNITKQTSPSEVVILGETISTVKMVWNNTVIKTSSNKFYMTGENAFGELGLGDTIERTIPEELTVSGETISDVSLGDYHTSVSTTSGKVYTTGDNDRGGLGLGDTTDRNTPTEVTIP